MLQSFIVGVHKPMDKVNTFLINLQPDVLLHYYYF